MSWYEQERGKTEYMNLSRVSSVVVDPDQVDPVINWPPGSGSSFGSLLLIKDSKQFRKKFN
jgi:hypothetical protein